LSQITLFPRTSSFSEIIPLPASKSESNRALIINALAKGSLDNLSNLAEARDTQTMIRLLSENGAEADVLDAGTTMRFLTAYYAVTGTPKKMTGTPRMCERPIGILVDALRTLGADITYLNQEGYPPLQLNGFSRTLTAASLGIRRNQLYKRISSVYEDFVYVYIAESA
jgi:3-phosphoshikimate 1-carboxyvinyltransferase